MDNYKGIIIKDMSLIADTEQAFETQLQNSLSNWKSQGARSI
jgi:hypothetical protein